MATPTSLYKISLENVSKLFSCFRDDIPQLSYPVLFDITYQLYTDMRLSQLDDALTDLTVFGKLLQVTERRTQLHRCFQYVVDPVFQNHSSPRSNVLYPTHCTSILGSKYTHLCSTIDVQNLKEVNDAVTLGLSLASFLAEAGWHSDAESILVVAQSFVKDSASIPDLIKDLECSLRLLHVQNANCRFERSALTYARCHKLIRCLESAGCKLSLGALYSEFSSHYILRSDYSEAYRWSMKSVEEVHCNTSPAVLVDIYRTASKACILKREFKKAKLLILQAVYHAKEYFGKEHIKYASTLKDYGLYLLNVDDSYQALRVYEEAVDMFNYIFDFGCNLNIAMSHEDLAYTSYVYFYAKGHFTDAVRQAHHALELMKMLLPSDHLLLASTKRVKALILEEIAIEHSDEELRKSYLKESHELHTSALDLTVKALGTMNIQTAKHYGNLGRLYQSMKKFEEAEKMHLKAIRIKEHLLGPSDYETAVSVGHLASLYNYDLKYFFKAEQLYFRSIDIATGLFGESFSGLEYDYRGLLHLYTQLNKEELKNKYKWKLIYWKMVREWEHEGPPLPVETAGAVMDVGTVQEKLRDL